MSGDVIDKGQVIMTVEGMKMEVCYMMWSWYVLIPYVSLQTNILAPTRCVVKDVLYGKGDIVPNDSKVCVLEDILEE